MTEIVCTNTITGQQVKVTAAAFSGRFFPAHAGIWSAHLRDRRRQDGAFTLELIEQQGVAAFVAGGQAWIGAVA